MKREAGACAPLGPGPVNHCWGQRGAGGSGIEMEGGCVFLSKPCSFLRTRGLGRRRGAGWSPSRDRDFGCWAPRPVLPAVPVRGVCVSLRQDQPSRSRRQGRGWLRSPRAGGRGVTIVKGRKHSGTLLPLLLIPESRRWLTEEETEAHGKDRVVGAGLVSLWLSSSFLAAVTWGGGRGAFRGRGHVPQCHP